jgi:hypothetical protein
VGRMWEVAVMAYFINTSWHFHGWDNQSPGCDFNHRPECGESAKYYYNIWFQNLIFDYNLKWNTLPSTLIILFPDVVPCSNSMWWMPSLSGMSQKATRSPVIVHQLHFQLHTLLNNKRGLKEWMCKNYYSILIESLSWNY